MSTLYEQETIIRFDESNDNVDIYTACPRRMNKFKRMGFKVDYKTKDKDGVITGMDFKIPKSWVRVGKYIKIGKPAKVSESQRLAGKRLMANLKKRKMIRRKQGLA